MRMRTFGVVAVLATLVFVGSQGAAQAQYTSYAVLGKADADTSATVSVLVTWPAGAVPLKQAEITWYKDTASGLQQVGLSQNVNVTPSGNSVTLDDKITPGSSGWYKVLVIWTGSDGLVKHNTNSNYVYLP